jgi:diguanylate cyclase (GGDEF)-like protein
MLFDIRTLLIAVALSTLICAGARALLWRLHPSLPGLGNWALACLMGGVALTLIAARGAIAEIFSLTLAQMLISLGFVIAWDGFRAFVGRKRLPVPLQAAALLGPLVLTALAHFEDSLPLRSIFNALIMAFFSGLIAFDLLYQAAAHRPARRITGWLYAANAVFSLARAVAAEQEPGSLGEMQSSGLMAVTLLWWMCMTMSITLGMVLMAAEVLRESLDRQASLDPLTGALNRRAFSRHASRELARSRRTHQPLSVLMMDLDHFKQINDRLGHATGDIALRLFVSVAERVLRQEDIFCRWGGEEFVTLLPMTSSAQAFLVAERLRLNFAREAAELAPEADEIGFTVSLGIAQCLPGEELEDMLRRADLALYQAKALGRNRSETALPFIPPAPRQLPAEAGTGLPA